MAGGEPQPVSDTAATQAASKPRVAAVEPERCEYKLCDTPQCQRT